jgi:hypothetical protein
MKQYHLVKTNAIHILEKNYAGDLSVMTNLKYYDFLFDYRDLREMTVPPSV